jgi:hypothetical protein
VIAHSDFESTKGKLIGVVIAREGDEIVFVAIGSISRVSVAVFALSAIIDVGFALERTGCGMRRACTPTVERCDIVEVAVTDTTNRLAGVRRAM